MMMKNLPPIWPIRPVPYRTVALPKTTRRPVISPDCLTCPRKPQTRRPALQKTLCREPQHVFFRFSVLCSSSTNPSQCHNRVPRFLTLLAVPFLEIPCSVVRMLLYVCPEMVRKECQCMPPKHRSNHQKRCHLSLPCPHLTVVFLLCNLASHPCRSFAFSCAPS